MNDERNEKPNRKISVLKEEVSVVKKPVVTGKVVAEKSFVSRQEVVSTTLRSAGYRQESHPVNREIEEVPEIRRQGDRVIIPVVREEVVVTKKLVLVEEIHLIGQTSETLHEEVVDLLETRVDIRRE